MPARDRRISKIDRIAHPDLVTDSAALFE